MMLKKMLLMSVLGVMVVGLMFSGCAMMQEKPTDENFQEPTVKLSYGEVAHYWGWWYYSKKIKPTMGDAGDYGAPLDLAFTFDVTNPNPYPVKLEDIRFTVAFEEFDLNTVNATQTQWIPPGKTNQVRVHAMFDGRQSLLSLLVTGGFKLKEKGFKPGPGGALKQLSIWWKNIPEFSFPIHIKEGSAVFSVEEADMTKVVKFSDTFPEE